MQVKKALWLAPALLAPIFMTTLSSSTAQGQTPGATRTITDSSQTTVDTSYVVGWLDHAVVQKESGAAAKSFAEAIRGWRMLETTDPAAAKQLQSRLGAAQAPLRALGIKQQDIKDVTKTLGAMARAPSSTQAVNPIRPPVVAAGSTFPAMPAMPTANTPQQRPDTTARSAPVGVVQAAGAPNIPTVGAPVAPGVFFPARDTTSNQPAASQIELAVPAPLGNGASGDELYRRGLELLSKGERQSAFEHFQRAWQFQGEMDFALRNQLKDKLSSMQAVSVGQGTEGSDSTLQRASQEEMAMRQRMMSEVTGEIAQAEANRESEPQVVAERLQTLRVRVSQAPLDGNVRKQLLTIVDRAIASHLIYMNQNRASIDQNLRNQQITEQRAMDEEQRFKMDQQIASLVETYNDLMDKGEFMQAETVAKQVGAIDRNSTIAKLLVANSRNARRIGEYEEIRNMREDLNVDVMLDVDRAARGGTMTDAELIRFGDADTWRALTKRRAETVRESERGMSPAERAIWEKLKQPVLVDFKERPLAEVIRVLSDMTGVLMYIDQDGLAAEGYTSDTPVTLSLGSQISLRSALSLLLNSKNLDFDVRNEVLMITSARGTSAANDERTYSVKDLVIPIPNSTTDQNSGLAGAIRHAYETVGRGLAVRQGPVPGVSGGVQLASASINPNAAVLGQLNNVMPGGGNLPNQFGGGFGLGGGGTGPVMGNGMMGGSPMAMGSPGAIGGGAAMADFDTLMNLIQQTIEPDSWLAAGGASTINPYPSNLSIVVSAPQTTHERITDLLESLRRLQDLQVTIEVKFITLNDNFFERIGVDFDLRIDDNVRQLPLDDQGPSTTVGLSGGFSPGGPIPFTADFDVGLTQDGFTSAVPAFGGFDAASGASLGFAILSDLEMFFFMNAAQGDQRTNVLQAPRVTMFDGQFASINDTISRPFVTSLIPVVADFAVAQQPVIVVLNEGTVLNVQATVSPDKRFVRLTLNPSFSQIDRVDTFTFQGTQTTDSGTNVLDPAGAITGNNDNTTTTNTATTVQQPSFASTSVQTTVSVPDGGTILLGGIKRMREGRIERGVPILSKIPYVNRLFKNTAIGRETSTLMMTVTPRIIIQEEEEEKYGVGP